MKKYLTIAAGLSIIGALIFFAPYKNPVLFGDTTSALLPTSGTNAGAGVDWTTPNNITVGTDAANAFYQTGAASKDLLGSAFGFAIPSNATINGIEVQLRGIQPDGSYSVNVYIYKGGSRAGTPTTTGFNGGAPNTVTKGSPTDLWGTTWTAADINADNFGAAVASPGNSNLTSIYWMKITVYYTLAAPDSQVVIQNATQVITNANMVIQ